MSLFAARDSQLRNRIPGNNRSTTVTELENYRSSALKVDDYASRKIKALGLGPSWAPILRIVKAWLNGPNTWFSSRVFLFLLTIHYFIKELLYAFLLSKKSAEVMNSVTKLHEHKDLSGTY